MRNREQRGFTPPAAQKENPTEHRAVLHGYEETPAEKKEVGRQAFLDGESCH